MQKVFNLTNKYIVLATPLILYALFSSIYLAVSASGGKIIGLFFAIFLFTLMSGAFIAGWFNMIKTAILEPDREDVNSLLKEFPSGVGEYFLPALGAILVIFMIFTVMFTTSYFVGINTIGDPKISAEALSKAMQSTIELKAFVSSLSVEQLTKISLWNMLILGIMTVGYFLMMLYLPVIFFKNKNPFVAFFVSLKDLFSKKFFKTLGIYLLIFVVNFFISALSTIFGANSMIHFIMTLINFYFVTFVGVGIFYYYYNNFIQNNVGQNVDVEV